MSLDILVQEHPSSSVIDARFPHHAFYVYLYLRVIALLSVKFHHTFSTIKTHMSAILLKFIPVLPYMQFWSCTSHRQINMRIYLKNSFLFSYVH